MPVGIVVKSWDIVNAKFAVKIPNINFEDVSSNDCLDGIRIVLDYILSQKRAKRK